MWMKTDFIFTDYCLSLLLPTILKIADPNPGAKNVDPKHHWYDIVFTSFIHKKTV